MESLLNIHLKFAECFPLLKGNFILGDARSTRNLLGSYKRCAALMFRIQNTFWF